MAATDKLDLKRKDLVQTAEKVIQTAFSSGRKLDLKKTQLSHLIGICGEASCAEEIENYLRYQAGRGPDKTGWDMTLAKSVISSLSPILEGMTDAMKLEAWRLYAVYMTRSFTYEYACAKPQGQNR